MFNSAWRTAGFSFGFLEGGGLVKFDGISLPLFRKRRFEQQSNHFSGGGSGGISGWVPGSGLMKFDGTYFSYYTEDQMKASNVVTALAVDQKNQIWVGTNAGLNVLISKVSKRVPPHG